MEIEYKITLKDCENYFKDEKQCDHLSFASSTDEFVGLAIISLIISLLISYFVFNFEIKWTIILFASICLIMYLLTLYGNSYSVNGKQLYELLENMSKNEKIILHDNMMERHWGNSISTYSFKDIKHIYNTENNLLLFINMRQAIIIPKGAFSSEEHINEFWNAIKTMYDNTYANEESNIKLSYELTLDDYENFYKKLPNFHENNFMPKTIKALNVIIGLFLISSFFTRNLSFIIILFIVVLVISIITNSTSFLGKYAYKEDKVKKHDITIGENKIIIKKALSNYQYNGAQIKQIYNVKNDIVIQFQQAKYIFIPKRIFNSEEELNCIWNKLKQMYH